MQIIQKEYKIADDVDHAIEWLKKEYPKGLDLYYVDRGESFDDHLEVLREVITDGFSDTVNNWYVDGADFAITELLENYQKEVGADDLSEDVSDEMRDWMYENDTSSVTQDLLDNTRNQLAYIELEDTMTKEYIDVEDLKKEIKRLQDTYAKTDDERKEIAHTVNESFYNSNISFYFYISPSDLYKAIHDTKGEYIKIDGAYFSTITRQNGSNWLGDKAVFRIAVKREDFLKGFHFDKEKGTGYGWHEIAGQCVYDEAGIVASDTVGDYLLLTPFESYQAKRERELSEKWTRTKVCTLGDMNYARHNSADQEYKNEYPCGTTCKKCGTFWID